MARCIADSNLGTSPDTYLYTLARAGDVFATIGSDDALRFFDISLKLSKKVPAANKGLSCLYGHGSEFTTAGRDGLIRRWDSRSARPTFDIAEVKGNPISSIACQDYFVAAGTESAKEGLGDVSVLVYDTRKPSTPLRNYAESHTDTITQLTFHPTQPHILLSSSTDGLISFFDSNMEDEEDALQRVLNPRSAVHCAGFLRPTEVYVATTDEHFSVHSLDDAEEASVVVDFGDVRESLNCTYIVEFLPTPRPVLVCGHHGNQSLSLVQLDASASASYAFGSRIDLPGAHGEEIVRDLMLLHQEKKAVSCGEDGHVKVWDLAGVMASAADDMIVD